MPPNIIPIYFFYIFIDAVSVLLLVPYVVCWLNFKRLSFFNILLFIANGFLLALHFPEFQYRESTIEYWFGSNDARLVVFVFLAAVLAFGPWWHYQLRHFKWIKE